MKTIWLPLTCIALVACAQQPTEYTEHDPRLVGTWGSADLDPSYIAYGEEMYFADGTLCGFILVADTEGKELSLYRAHWKITGDQLKSVVDASNDPLLPVGNTSLDHILETRPDRIQLKSLHSGHTYYRFRAPEDRSDRICALQDPSQFTSPTR